MDDKKTTQVDIEIAAKEIMTSGGSGDFMRDYGIDEESAMAAAREAADSLRRVAASRREPVDCTESLMSLFISSYLVGFKNGNDAAIRKMTTAGDE